MIDIHSDTWSSIKKHAQAHREAYARRLLSNGVDHSESQYLRGQIAALDKILALPSEVKEAPITLTPYE